MRPDSAQTGATRLPGYAAAVDSAKDTAGNSPERTDSQRDESQNRESQSRETVTRTLDLASRGDKVASGDLMSLVYDDLRRVAGNLLRSERKDHTLQATALVHEAWMRLVDESVLKTSGGGARRKFLGYAAQSMRRILIEHARARMRIKRGGGQPKVELTECLMPNFQDAPALLELDEALDKLTERKERAARIAELRLYGGLSTAEAADVAEVSLATAKSDWALAQAFLSQQVRDHD